MLIHNIDRHTCKLLPPDICHYIQLHSVYEYILFPHTLPSTAQPCSSLLTDGDTDPVTNLQSHTTWIRDWMVHLSGISWYHLKPQPSPPQQSLHSGKNPWSNILTGSKSTSTSLTYPRATLNNSQRRFERQRDVVTSLLKTTGACIYNNIRQSW